MTDATVEVPPAANYRFVTFMNAIVFVLGFSLVFIVGWGGAITLMGQLFAQYKTLIAQIGGAVVIVFGLETLGVVCLPWLHFELRPQWKVNWSGGPLAPEAKGTL